MIYNSDTFLLQQPGLLRVVDAALAFDRFRSFSTVFDRFLL